MGALNPSMSLEKRGRGSRPSAQVVHYAGGLRGLEPHEHPVDEDVMRGDEYVFPAVEVPVERRVGDAHRFRDARHAGACQSVLGHQPQGLFDDLGAPLHAGSPALAVGGRPGRGSQAGAGQSRGAGPGRGEAAEARSCSPQVSHDLDDGGHALAAADAHGGQAVAAAGAEEAVEKGRQDAAARSADGVTQSDGSARHVRFGHVEVQ